MRSLLTILACVLFLSACHKSKNSNTLVGKWKATEIIRAGQIDWSTVSPSEEITFTFNNNYSYILAPPMFSSVAACSGTYRIANANTVMLTSSCRQDPTFEEEMGFTVSGNTLILDYRMTATAIRIKYKRQ